MKKRNLIIILLVFYSCNTNNPVQFSEKALEDTFISLEGESQNFRNIIQKYHGQSVFVNVWASWCRDCIKGMPNVKEIQNEYPEAIFLFLSLDRNLASWKKGIKKYQLKGEHYFIQSGWNGPFGEFLNLNWIPRYLVIDKLGNIKLFKATKASDKNLKTALQ